VSLGGMFTYHAGITNVAMEGLLLISAFFAVVFSWMTGSALAGVVAGVIAAVLLSLLYSLFVTTLKANNFAIGFALNILASSLTLYLMRIMFKGKNVFTSPDIKPVGVLSVHTGIRLLDECVFNFSILTYAAILLLLVGSYVVYRTSFGLRLRVAGENPSALEVAGVKNSVIQYVSSILCGICCGLAGAQLSLHNVRMFARDMSNGRGFIALAIILIARGRPLPILLISLLFGLFDALTFTIQGAHIPPQFALMLPYVMSVLILFAYCAADARKRAR